MFFIQSSNGSLPIAAISEAKARLLWRDLFTLARSRGVSSVFTERNTSVIIEANLEIKSCRTFFWRCFVWRLSGGMVDAMPKAIAPTRTTGKHLKMCSAILVGAVASSMTCSIAAENLHKKHLQAKVWQLWIEACREDVCPGPALTPVTLHDFDRRGVAPQDRATTAPPRRQRHCPASSALSLRSDPGLSPAIHGRSTTPPHTVLRIWAKAKLEDPGGTEAEGPAEKPSPNAEPFPKHRTAKTTYGASLKAFCTLWPERPYPPPNSRLPANLTRNAIKKGLLLSSADASRHQAPPLCPRKQTSGVLLLEQPAPAIEAGRFFGGFAKKEEPVRSPQ